MVPFGTEGYTCKSIELKTKILIWESSLIYEAGFGNVYAKCANCT